MEIDLIDELKNRPLLIGSLFGSFLFVYLTKKYYFSGGTCRSKVSLDGKTVIITGANTGIGKETAIDLAKRGARVILACRDSQRANQAANEIRQNSGNGNVVVELVDLASFKSIRDFCQRINSNEDRVDILINNAAIMACPRWLTEDGFETQFAVNHLAPFLLTNLLLDKIKKCSPSRIVNVNALAYELGVKRGLVNLDDLNLEKSYDPWQAYERSKIFNILFTVELAKKLEGTGVSVNALHPGIIITDIGRYISEAYKIPKLVYDLIFLISWPLRWWFMKNVIQGAQTTIYCAIDESLNNVNGKYFSDCKERKLLAQVLDEKISNELWRISEKLTNLKQQQQQEQQ